jgi:hypothetical protein
MFTANLSSASINCCALSALCALA